MTRGRPTLPAAPLALLVLVAWAAALGACGAADGTQLITADQVARLQPGMGAAEVKEILGGTSERTEEHWVYRPAEGPFVKIDVFLDHNGEVASVSTSDR